MTDLTTGKMHSCAVYRAGVVSYAKGLEIQREVRVIVESARWDGVLVLLEHTPVITIGRSGGLENLLLSRDVLANKGVYVVDTDRGGNITGHNPGQLVGYPILNLNRWRRDVHWYFEHWKLF